MRAGSITPLGRKAGDGGTDMVKVGGLLAALALALAACGGSSCADCVNLSGIGLTGTYGVRPGTGPGRLPEAMSAYFAGGPYSCHAEIGYSLPYGYGRGEAQVVRIWIDTQLFIDERAYSGVFRWRFINREGEGERWIKVLVGRHMNWSLSCEPDAAP